MASRHCIPRNVEKHDCFKILAYAVKGSMEQSKSPALATEGSAKDCCIPSAVPRSSCIDVSCQYRERYLPRKGFQNNDECGGWSRMVGKQ